MSPRSIYSDVTQTYLTLQACKLQVNFRLAWISHFLPGYLKMILRKKLMRNVGLGSGFKGMGLIVKLDYMAFKG
jgi:hypothetical protein